MTCTSTTTTTEMDFFHSNFMLHNPHHDEEDNHLNNQPSTSLPPHVLPTNCNPHQEFHGVATLLGKRPSMPLINEEMTNHGGLDQDDLSDDGSQLGEKKRRLNMEQVRTLEKNFELGNKLEPERKMQLARALGLQPRQIAIWFQNRRARWKTKQLEKDYELLKRQFEVVKAENEALQSHNQKLHAEIMALKTREPTESINLNKETEGSCSNRSENSSDIKLDINSRSNQAIDSPNLSNGGAHFPSTLIRPAQLFQSTTPSSRPDPKIDHGSSTNHVKEEGSLCNMFVGMDEHTGFWPWLELQHFN